MGLPADPAESLPRTARPREWLLACHRDLLIVRQRMVTAGGHATGSGWAGHARIRAAVATVDQLRDELLALAVDADAWRRRVDAAKAERLAKQADAPAGD